MNDNGDRETASARVRYREGQTVARADLAAEQQYLVAMRRRHHVGPHRWGIASGLEVTAAGAAVTVDAGIAIDGYGRELIVPEPIVIPPSYFLQLDSNRVAIAVTYDTRDLVHETRDRWNCAPGAQNRTIERTRLRLTALGPLDSIDPRRPPEVPTTDHEFGPEGSAPDDSERQWPVFLGVVERASSTDPWQVSAAYKGQAPYAGLRGQVVTAASGIVRMRLGHELEEDNRAFAVDAVTTDASKERLGIDSSGKLFFAEDTTIAPRDRAPAAEGNLTINRAPVDVTLLNRAGLAGCTQTGADTQPRFWGMEFKNIPVPETATPWHVYHAAVPHTPGPNAPPPFDELRFEFLNPGKKGNRKGNRFVIGTRINGRFSPCLTVDAECTVTIGDPQRANANPKVLQIDGQLVPGPIQVDPKDPRFHSLMLSGWLQGMLGNTQQLANYYSGAVTVSAVAPAQARVGVEFVCAVTLRNTGTAPLTNVRITETHNLAGTQVILPAPFDLAAGQQQSVDVRFRSPSAGRFSCTVTATGTAQTNAGSYDVTGSDDVEVNVVHAARIDASLQAPAHAVVGAQVTYQPQVRNDGAGGLSSVFFASSLDTGSTEDLLSGVYLQHGEQRQFPRQTTRSTPGTRTISVVASGVGDGLNNDALDNAQATITFHAPTSVSAAIVGLAATGDEGVAMLFTFRVTNTSGEAVTLEAVTPTTSPANGTFAAVTVGQTIQPGANLALTMTYMPSAVATVTITVAARVRGLGGDTATDSANGTTSISPVIN